MAKRNFKSDVFVHDSDTPSNQKRFKGIAAQWHDESMDIKLSEVLKRPPSLSHDRHEDLEKVTNSLRRSNKKHSPELRPRDLSAPHHSVEIIQP